MKHTKPFNLEHARAGAPFRTLADESVEILKWDMKYGNCPLLGIVGDEQVGARWAADGTPNGASPSNYQLVMTSLGLIDGKPVFYLDEVVNEKGDKVKAQNPAFDRWYLCRRPAPAKTYPTTQMTGPELIDLISVNAPVYDNVRNLANAALRHACDNGQVVTREEFDRALGDRDDRDMAVAAAVRSKAISYTSYGSQARELLQAMTLQDIIEQVKA